MIPGLASLDGFSSERRRLHEAALSVLVHFEREGVPFALVLRTFHYFWLSGARPGVYGTHLIDDDLYAACRRRRIAIVTIQAQNPQNPAYDILYVRKKKNPFRARMPAFLVDVARWREAVRYLIERAELVISLVPVDSEGALQ